MKITKILVLPLVLLLAVVIGCDENNNMMSMQEPGEGDPPAMSMCEGVNLDDCPCDYDLISRTAACWLLSGPDLSSVVYRANESSCELAVSVNDTDSTPFLEADTAGFCTIRLEMQDAPICSETNIFVAHEDLTQEETTACLCRLEQYTKELIQAGIEVSDDTASALTSEEISCPAQ